MGNPIITIKPFTALVHHVCGPSNNFILKEQDQQYGEGIGNTHRLYGTNAVKSDDDEADREVDKEDESPNKVDECDDIFYEDAVDKSLGFYNS